MDQRFRERLAPGFWTDADGALHVSIVELLEFFDWPDTPANRGKVEGWVLETMAEAFPGATITAQPACPFCGSEGLAHSAGCEWDC